MSLCDYLIKECRKNILKANTYKQDWAIVYRFCLSFQPDICMAMKKKFGVILLEDFKREEPDFKKIFSTSNNVRHALKELSHNKEIKSLLGDKELSFGWVSGIFCLTLDKK